MKLIAIDLDGTLLTTESKISAENRAAIKRAVDAGILVTICTGRATFDVKALLEDLDIPIIAANGGTVHDTGYRLISKTLMDQQAGKDIADYLLSQNIYFEVYTDHHLLSPFDGQSKLQAELDILKSANPDEDFHTLWQGAITQFKQFGIKPVHDIQSVFDGNENVYKLLCFSFDMEKLKRAKEELTHHQKLSQTSSGKHIIEILPASSGKGRALTELAGRYGIEKQDIYAIGDSPNDLSMFEVAGHGIAMENAIEELKEKSTFVTKSNDENGVAYFIDQLLANQYE
ncbi:Cof-type HAD-IIB family hydrolase [Bacillus atrophaeus]|uniref:Cof-type HAD-IIB family hydrolase n=1 Tax=Bacillus atrophaeus TaxID=1452 RepID=UPI00227DDF0C|nr:Cof-type HAD-IIB family hydrolase [Bacillus atrophaeus]MCY8915588.1 Cof-type HAD-IIB family hydrolase [Bacillus atrophaeus]MCY8924373.1 Cof-type HAD-IIB family hydrolase [Bacillus atrophaeus]MEC0697160.1 Cof-type HAD-IIB family hydrolase [Bacillus atrophaeus]